jgi:recombinational DNA repair protein (RecF pathway)
MKLYKTEALVLRSRDCGRGDKLLILYSRLKVNPNYR